MDSMAHAGMAIQRLQLQYISVFILQFSFDFIKMKRLFAFSLPLIRSNYSVRASLLKSHRLCPSSFGLSRAFSVHPQVGAPLRKKMTTMDIARKYKNKEAISMVTAYTYPSAVHVDAAGIDILLVGDSLGMVELGYDTTLPVTMQEMLHHCQAVSRGAETPLLVADMPFGSYEASPEVRINKQ